MVGEAFTNPWGDPINYGCGQPMGAYSSFPSFALCHHFVVYLAAIKAGIAPKSAQYALLGDDIVIRGKRLATAYLSILDELGVPISESKTLESKDS